MTKTQLSLESHLIQSNQGLKEEQGEVHVNDVSGWHEGRLDEKFVDSVRRYGVIEPIIVVPNDHGGSLPYRVIAGRRRLAAARIVGLEKIKMVLRKYEIDSVSLLVTLTENQQRSENPVAEYRALKELVSRGFMLDEIMETSGLNEAKIERLLRLDKLPDEILDGVETGKVAFGTAVQMTKLGYEKYKKLVEKFRQDGKLTGKDVHEVREAEVGEELQLAAESLVEELGGDYGTNVGGKVEVSPAWIPEELAKEADEYMVAYEIGYDAWMENAWRLAIGKIKRVEKKEAKAAKNGKQAD